MKGVGVQIRTIFANGKFWSGILCAASFSRGTAYLERPPPATTYAGRAIETYIKYPTWGALLLATMTIVVIAHVIPPLRSLGIWGHTLSVIIYGTFGLSLGASALVSSESWANTGLYLVAALLHAACAIYFADEVALNRRERSLDLPGA
jgi:hypothetical protein